MTNQRATEKRNLIICAAGDKKSYHKEWILGQRKFDLMLVHYGNISGQYKEDADLYFEKKGFKLEIIKDAIDANMEKIENYDAIWLPDDDLSICTEEINRLFEIFYEFNLDLAQPSIVGGNHNFLILKKRLFSRVRYTTFIEVQCPIFKKKVLLEMLPFFKENRSGWGVDLIWSHRLRNQAVAIIDEVSVIHTRKSTPDSLHYKNLASLGIEAGIEYQALIERHGLKKSMKKKTTGGIPKQCSPHEWYYVSYARMIREELIINLIDVWQNKVIPNWKRGLGYFLRRLLRVAKRKIYSIMNKKGAAGLF
ncbi:hypothetical protein N9K06_00950 [Omnitrophica bacterium]|nr:hypothetical protein [Candidatus Omnitrophota bacterium]